MDYNQILIYPISRKQTSYILAICIQMIFLDVIIKKKLMWHDFKFTIVDMLSHNWTSSAKSTINESHKTKILHIRKLKIQNNILLDRIVLPYSLLSDSRQHYIIQIQSLHMHISGKIKHRSKLYLSKMDYLNTNWAIYNDWVSAIYNIWRWFVFWKQQSKDVYVNVNKIFTNLKLKHLSPLYCFL